MPRDAKRDRTIRAVKGRARTQTAAPRVTIMRQRPEPQPEKRAKLHTGPGFPDVESATRYLLTRAEDLVQDGVLPRLPLDPYLDALVPVLGFIYARAGLFAEANLGPEVCAAVEQIAQELQTAPDTSVPEPAPASTQEQDALSTGALLLTAYRDAIRRVARGPKGQQARTDFAVGEPVDARNPKQVAAAIAAFLEATRRHPEYVQEAGLSDNQLSGLGAQRRIVAAMGRTSRPPGTASGVQRTRVLRAALEYFFDRFSAAVSAKLIDRPEDRVKGLRLVPRSSIGRSGGLRSTDPS